MLVTILTLLCLSQDSVVIHLNCINLHNFGLDIRKFSFSLRVINIWNALPYSVLQCNTVGTFKRHLDLCLKNWGYL